MTAPVIGQDCHIKLSHAGIDAGAPYGFLVDERHKVYPEGVRINRETVSGGLVTVWVHADVVLADDLLNPDGTRHSATRAEMYAKLLEFLDQDSGIEMETPVGTLVNLGALGFTADERHLPRHSIVKLQLNNAGTYYPPVDADLLALSVWDGTLTWADSYWR